VTFSRQGPVAPMGYSIVPYSVAKGVGEFPMGPLPLTSRPVPKQKGTPKGSLDPSEGAVAAVPHHAVVV